MACASSASSACRTRWPRTPSRRASSPSTAATASSSTRSRAAAIAGYDWPQLSIHRADLHKVLLDATLRAAGRATPCGSAIAASSARPERQPASRCISTTATPQRGKVAVGCDGIHSAVRRQLFPDEGPPKYSGVNMWRGAVRWPAFLGGDTMVSTGWMTVGKTVIYPVRPGTPGDRRQAADQLGRRDRAARGGAPGLDRPRPARGHDAGLRRPQVRLPRHQRHDRGDRGDPRIPHGRPRPAAALELRPHHPAGRRRPSDVPARLQRRGPGDRRCALPHRPDQAARRHAERR